MDDPTSSSTNIFAVSTSQSQTPTSVPVFTLQSHMVRGDLFTKSGKWKYTVQIDMSIADFNHWDIAEEVEKCFWLTDASVRGVVDGVSDMWLIVLDPYMKNGYPQMIWLSNDT